MKMVSQLGWKAVFYDRDFGVHRHKYSTATATTDPSPSGIYGEHLERFARAISEGSEFNGINPVGAVTDFAPWNTQGVGSLPASYNSLAAMRFVYATAILGYHNYILSSDTVYEGLPGSQQTPIETAGFANWMRMQQSYSDAIGYLLLPPDQAVATEMRDNLNALRGRIVPPFVQVND